MDQDRQQGDNEMDGIDSLLIPRVPLRLSGEELIIEPMRVKHLPVVLKAIALLYEQLVAGADPLVAVGNCMPQLASAIAAVVGRPVEWVEDLPLDDCVALTLEVVEVNRDFFRNKVLPRVQALGWAGSMLSSA